jgi:hypothetical protein
MVVMRRGGAIVLVMALLGSAAAGCAQKRSSLPGGGGGDVDGAVYQSCTSVCRRPGDCAEAFPDDGICPPGFLCALRFSCSTD